MEHIWSVLCRTVLINQVTQAISLIDTIDRINIMLLPGQDSPIGGSLPIEMALVTSWRRTVMERPEIGKVKVILNAPGGQVLASDQGDAPVFDVNLQDAPRSRGTITFHGIPYVGSGIYWIVVQAQMANGSWQNVANIPLEIIEGLLEQPGVNIVTTT